MTERDQNDIAKNQPLDELDDALDAALAKYAAVEPRVGLEQRIMASLSAQASPSQNRRWWQWTFAAAALAIMVFALAMAWRSTRGSPRFAHNENTTAQRQPESKQEQADVGVSRPALPPHAVHRHAPARGTRRAVAADIPKLDHFPSPQALSDEELALVHYAAHFPLEARVIARAQEEYARESQQRMRISGAEVQPSGSDEQER
jgi:hypothetical protein